MKKSGLLWAGLAVLFAAGAAAAYFHFRPRPAPLPETAAEAGPSPTELTIPGLIRARHIVTVAAPMDGTLESMDLVTGQDVFEGQLLARIRSQRLDLELEEAKLDLERLEERVRALDSQVIAARLEASRADADASRARAALAAAEKDFSRQKTLFAEGATPRLTYENAERQYLNSKSEVDALAAMAQTAQARLEVLQKNLEEARRLLAEKQRDLETIESAIQEGAVHSPVDGILIAYRAGPGEEVTVAMKDLFQIAVNLSEWDFVAAITPEQEKQLASGMPVILQLAELGGSPLAGVIKTAARGELIVEFSSSDAAIRPGLSAQVRVPLTPLNEATPRTSPGSR